MSPVTTGFAVKTRKRQRHSLQIACVASAHHSGKILLTISVARLASSQVRDNPVYQGVA